MRLDDNEFSISGARRADVTGLGAQEPRSEELALPKSVESGKLSVNKAVVGSNVETKEVGMRPVILGLFLASVVLFAWSWDAQAKSQCPPGQHEVTTRNGTVMCVGGGAAHGVIIKDPFCGSGDPMKGLNVHKSASSEKKGHPCAD